MTDYIDPFPLSDELSFHIKVILITTAILMSLTRKFIVPRIISSFWSDYATFSKEKKRELNDYFITLTFSLIVVPWALYIVLYDTFEGPVERVFGYDAFTLYLIAFSSGKFLDELVLALWLRDWIFVLHGAIMFIAFAPCCFYPAYSYYGIRGLLYESSSIFLAIRSFLWHMNVKGSVQMINNILFVVFFIASRICYGWYITFWGIMPDLLTVIRMNIDPIRMAYSGVIFLTAVSATTLLNLFWLYKIFFMLRKMMCEKQKKE
eukprot:TRINITY_DN1038_c0_g1_i1.p1 TRINITY_DN1038_c0_g1~~TRINITY_DN1038_c0_g1_i1.p1  ORF type:complete len:263 (-),score=32.26 TRINITY_DN1038_c0_g1_i1:28-816(-)